MKSFLLGLLALILAGCATQNQSAWFRSGANQQDFETDKGYCNAQAFSLANGNIYQIAIIQNQCLQGKGWQLVDQNQLNNVYNELNTERLKTKRESEARCSNPEYSSIYAKTPCFANEIEFKQMTDETKITSTQKQVFVKWREAIDSGNEQALSYEVRLNGNLGKKYSSYFTSTMKPENDKNNLDIYSGKITWGQYNSRRKEIYTKMLDAMK